MDQILTPDADLINDDFDSKINSLVNSADENFHDSFTKDVSDGIRCENDNEGSRLDEKASQSTLENENSSIIGEVHDVSFAFCAESEAIPNGNDSSIIEENGSIGSAASDLKTMCNFNGSAAKDCYERVNLASNEDLKNNEIRVSVELPVISDRVPLSMLVNTKLEINTDSSNKSNEDLEDVLRGTANSTNNETVTSNHENNFLPTIVEIRGGCTDVLEKPSDQPHDKVYSTSAAEVPNLNIVNVLGGFEKTSSEYEVSTIKLRDNLEETSNPVHTISDSEEGSCPVLNKCSSNEFNNDVAIKQEPHDDVSDNDCVYMGTEHCTASFTSEIFIKEEKTSSTEVKDPEVARIETLSEMPLPIHQVEDSEVTCVETTSEIPLPIPIKMESIIEAENQSSSSTTIKTIEKNTSRKRITRSSSSKSDNCVLLSSGSDADDSSDSRKRTCQPKSTPYSTAGYTCHLCNTVFQEHELLNDHMILHRNNSLIEAKAQNRPKMIKMKSYTCDICHKRLSTSQSLQQHVMIHKNEKPYACPICKKDFRHRSNYRMHLQKHKAEQRRRSKIQQKSDQERLDKSIVRGVDFGRLVGPLFMKESLLHQKSREQDNVPSNSSPSSTATSTNTNLTLTSSSLKKIGPKSSLSSKESHHPQPRLSFDKPAFKTKENTIATTSLSSPPSRVVIRRRDPSPESKSEEECVPVKSFNNIESVVMNAAKIIVRLDNLDTSVLKRKLQTPDISIDLAPKKSKIMLSPIAEKCKIKLDEIENIPMDEEPANIDLSSAEHLADDHFDNIIEPDDNDETVSYTLDRIYDELFNLLNDDKDSSTVTTLSPSGAVGDGSNGSNSPMKQPSYCRLGDITKTSATVKPSNVIFMETPHAHDGMSYYNDDDDESTFNDQVDDSFDTAFRKVAERRLTLLHKRAAKNAGKVESHYLMGPLFWRKALRRAKKRTIESGLAGSAGGSGVSTAISSNSSNPQKILLGPRRYGGRSKVDDRRTNDPVKLQSRAETKFKCLMERAKMMNSLNAMNLAGPLFWRRTLQLAGVHRGNDLRTYMDAERLTLDGIEFVCEDGTLCDFGAELVVAQQQQQQRFLPPPPPPPPPSSSSLDRVPVSTASPNSDDRQQRDELPFAKKSSSATSGTSPDDATKPSSRTHSTPPLVEQPQQQLRRNVDATTATASLGVIAAKSDSILYESLTKPKENHQQPSKLKGSASNVSDAASLFVANGDGAAAESSLGSLEKSQLSENCLADIRSSRKRDDSIVDATLAVENDGIAKLAAIDSGSIVLNVDGGGGLQLIAANNDRGAISEAGQNYVLVSDETGTMQYMVNVPSENYGNFELISDGGGGGVGVGDQVAYAIQFDGENYTAVQFVQDGVGVELPGDKGAKDSKIQIDSKTAAYLVSNAGAAATSVVSDPNHIGKELSDFLNLDYGNLLKNGAPDQHTS